MVELSSYGCCKLAMLVQGAGRVSKYSLLHALAYIEVAILLMLDTCDMSAHNLPGRPSPSRCFAARDGNKDERIGYGFDGLERSVPRLWSWQRCLFLSGKHTGLCGSRAVNPVDDESG